MRKLFLRGRVVEISEHDFVQLVDHLARGYCELVKHCHHYHISGFADWRGTLWKTSQVEGQKLGKEFEAQIDDEALREAFHLLRECVQEMIKVDGQIVQWLTTFVGLSSLRDEQDKRLLDRRLYKIVRGGTEGPVGPIWAKERGYQALVERSAEVMRAASVLYRRIDQRLQQLLGVGEEGRPADSNCSSTS